MTKIVVTSVALAALALAATAVPAVAHHSGAMFDSTKTVVFSGTVKELQWTNPHSYVWIYKNPESSAEKAGDPDSLWAIELTSPGDLKRMGWNKDILKPGDKVTITFHPMHTDSHAGSIVSVTLPNGSVLQHDRSLAYKPSHE